MSLIRNYKCDKKYTSNEIINECARKVSNVEIKKELGRGSFGTVYLAIANIDGEDRSIAIKKIKLLYTDENDMNEALDSLFNEIEYSYYMGELDIGPTVYDAFYINDTVRNYIIQYIFMEPGVYSVGEYLLKRSIDDDRKKYVITSMIHLIHKNLFDVKMFCLDIKPDNFIITEDNKVKMIDFGADWCMLNKLPKIFHTVGKKYGINSTVALFIYYTENIKNI